MSHSLAARHSRLKLAETTSAIGAGILGAGIGSLLGANLKPFAVVILVLGLVMHGWGMFDKHRIEADAPVPRVWWAELLYWICWVTLAVLLVLLAVHYARS